MSERASASDLQRRFSACFFDQFVHTTMTNQVDQSYPWWISASKGLTTPYTNGLVGVHAAVGASVLPAQRGLAAVGNVLRDNQVQNFSFGLVWSSGGGPPPSTVPPLGQDNVLENGHDQRRPPPASWSRPTIRARSFADRPGRGTCAAGSAGTEVLQATVENGHRGVRVVDAELLKSHVRGRCPGGATRPRITVVSARAASPCRHQKGHAPPARRRGRSRG